MQFESPEESMARFLKERAEKKKQACIRQNLNNYVKFCLYSALILSEKEEKTNDPLEKEQYSRRSSEFISNCSTIKTILANECLCFEDFTEEDIREMWKNNYNCEPHPFAEIPLEYKAKD